MSLGRKGGNEEAEMEMAGIKGGFDGSLALRDPFCSLTSRSSLSLILSHSSQSQYRDFQRRGGRGFLAIPVYTLRPQDQLGEGNEGTGHGRGQGGDGGRGKGRKQGGDHTKADVSPDIFSFLFSSLLSFLPPSLFHPLLLSLSRICLQITKTRPIREEMADVWSMVQRKSVLMPMLFVGVSRQGTRNIVEGALREGTEKGEGAIAKGR